MSIKLKILSMKTFIFSSSIQSLTILKSIPFDLTTTDKNFLLENIEKNLPAILSNRKGSVVMNDPLGVKKSFILLNYKFP